MVARQPFESSNLGLVRKFFLKCFLLSQLKAAEEHKLKGIIIFSDPEQYAPTGTSYPDNWYLPKDGVQRGTVLRIKGDPLSNGYPALGESLLSYQQTSLYTLYHQYAPIAEKQITHSSLQASKYICRSNINVSSTVSLKLATPTSYIICMVLYTYVAESSCHLISHYESNIAMNTLKKFTLSHPRFLATT